MVAQFLTVDSNHFSMNGRLAKKVYQLDPKHNSPYHLYVINIYYSTDFLLKDWELSKISVNGLFYSTVEELAEELNAVIGSGAGGSSDVTLLQQIADNTEPIQSEVLPMEIELQTGTYTKAQLTASYGNGKKLCHIEAQANTGVDANSKVAVQMVGDATLDWSNTISKGDHTKTIKGYNEIADFTLNIEGSARVYLTFFTNLI